MVFFLSFLDWEGANIQPQNRLRKIPILHTIIYFRGNEYEKHTQCISEEEKYSGKNYVAKQSANKGEVKQQQWIEVSNLW